MIRKRPTAVLVLAILHLVGGGLGLVCTVCTGGMQLAGGNQMFAGPAGGANQSPQVKSQQEFQKRLEKHVETELPHQKAVTYANLGLDLVLDVMLISAGIGLLSVQPWARVVSLVYAALSILAKVIGLVNLAFTWPVMSAFIEQEGRRDPNLQMMTSMMPAIMVGTAVVTVLFLIYPIVVLVILLRPSIAAAFRGEYPPTPAEQEEPWGADRDRQGERDEPPSEAFTR
jgi:hypothetical protein